jgi:AcrR family transcriptional regulator
MNAAEEAFGEGHAQDVTVEELAERAGVAVGSLYNHFGSKAGLLAAVVEQALDVDRQSMDRAFRADRSPAEQVLAAANEYFTFYLNYPEFFQMLAFPPDPGSYAAGRELAERLARRVEEQNARLAAALRRGVAEGLFRPIDADQTATVLWAAWNGIISLAWRPDALRRNKRELSALLTVATEIIALGLVPRTSVEGIEIATGRRT